MIKTYKGKNPVIHESCFIAESADIVGDVTIGAESNIWYNAVIRGDENYIKIGKNTNVQDNCVVHISEEHPTIIGDNITIGHSAIVHACKIGNNSLIGMGVTILNGAEIGNEVMIGAGALVTGGKKIPSGVLLVGSPAKVIRELTEEEKQALRDSAKNYVQLGKDHKNSKICEK